ncbi:Uncharacterised protein [Mycobacteroides abscessus subsp. abscessus]|nr:Uncharacterised protein [Mycobacteroides abscessus subsp. abscessus]
MVEKFWRAIEWDFQEILHVNALDYFAAPCQCGQCRRDTAFHARYASRRDWDQFARFYETLLNRRGSYLQAMFLADPDVIEVQASAPDEEWAPQKPPLFGWTPIIEALTNIADQLIASRARDPDSVKFYPRPQVPAEVERKKRKATKQDGGIEAALARGMKADEANYR